MTCRHFFAVLFAIAALSGCVSQGKYQTLETTTAAERARLQADIAALRSQKQELEAQRAAQDSQRADLESERAALASEKTTAERQLVALNEQLAELEKRAMTTATQKDDEINRLKGTYDSLVRDLKGEIAKGQIKVTQVRDKLSVQLVEKILFDSGKAEIKPEGKEVLNKVGNILKTVTGKQIQIEGYTDSVPIGGALRKQFATNWELSTQRATTVVRFLQENNGLDGRYLSAVGYGPFRPAASNDTAEGRAENRRIEIVLTPLDVKGVLDQLQ